MTGELVTASIMNAHVRDNLLATRELIGSASGAGAALTVSGIAAGYHNLVLSAYMRGDTAATSVGVLLRFNNDAAGNYDYENLIAQAAGTTASEGLAQGGLRVATIPAASASASKFATLGVDVPAYDETTGHKSVAARAGGATGTTTTLIYIELSGGTWRSTAAITRVDLVPTAGSFVAGSRLDVYGMQA